MFYSKTVHVETGQLLKWEKCLTECTAYYIIIFSLEYLIFPIKAYAKQDFVLTESSNFILYKYLESQM